MTRPAPFARPLRVGAALAGVAGAVVLSGCGPATAEDAAGAGDDPAYRDGTYTAEGAYATPETVETITVTVTLESDIVTDVEVTGEPTRPESQQFQGQFIGGIAAEVEGRDIDEIAVSRVAGSSLTSAGFTDAIEAIKAEAAG